MKVFSLASLIVMFSFFIMGSALALDTTDDQTGIITAQGENGTSESKAKAFDNNNNTKWLDFSSGSCRPSWIQYQYTSGIRAVVTEYTITSANDAQERDPKDWRLLGSNDGGATWVTLDTRTNSATWTARLQKKSFTFTNTTAFGIYRLDILCVRGTGANSVQLAEIELIGTMELPEKAIEPDPANDEVNASALSVLSWTAGNSAQSHDVYFGTDSAAVTNVDRQISDLNGNGIVDWPDISLLTNYWLADPAGSEPYVGMNDDSIIDLFDFALLSQDWLQRANSVYKGNFSTAVFNPGTLALGTTYYWRVDEVSGPDIVRGDIWSFSTQSGKAFNPNPAQNAQYVDINPVLSWSAGTGATSHNVYFGTTNQPAFQGTQTQTTFDPGTLQPEVNYYWRIDEVGTFGTVQGDLLTFTTTNPGNTLVGKIMCGYQGWFACPGDGSGRSWAHWANGGTFSYTNLKIEMWPDMNEYAEKYVATGFTLGNPPYHVFSSYDANTTQVHFRWMSEYGIDGVFVQRFGSDFGVKNFLNTVLTNCKNAANMYQRKYAIMYDFTGYTTSSLASNIQTDWLDLENNYGITTDPTDESYIVHNGKPVIALYGVFGSGNYPNPAYVVPLIDWFRSKGFTILIGVNNDWLDVYNSNADFKACIDKSDIIMPWNVGRYATTQDVINKANGEWTQHLQWCINNNKEYSICVFPGFSWHNWNGGSFDAIPRRNGDFLWEQYYNAKRIGATMIYQAMFDEVDESSAIFKVTNDPPPPSGNIEFLTLHGLDSDYYLWLVGEGTRMLRGQIPMDPTRPVRP